MLIIGIAGGTGSGKTTVVRKIIESLPAGEVVLLPQDSYYKDSSHVPVEERQNINFDHPDAFDWGLLSKHVAMLREGKSIEQPTYSYLTCTREPETIHIEPREVVIIEGILALCDKKLRSMMDLKIFVDADPDERLIRVIQRDVVERGRTAEAVMERYTRILKPMHLQFIEPCKRYADLIIPEGGNNQVAIDIHPDPEDFHPRLSFCYNSQQRESALGYGWNISGLSGITHVAGTIYYDGKSSPLSLNEDKLMLDGIRLLKTGTNSWQSEQGFVKVKKLANGSLQARYPDGNIALFEAFAQAPFSYVMTSYTNRKGRTIKYDYTQVDNLPYIRKILYGEAGSVYNDSIVFTYRNVTDDITRYVDGKAFKYSRLLEKVESF